MVKLWVISLESALGRGFGVGVTEEALALELGDRRSCVQNSKSVLVRRLISLGDDDAAPEAHQEVKPGVVLWGTRLEDKESIRKGVRGWNH